MDDLEDTIANVEQAWWKSKKMLTTLSYHVLSSIGAFTSILLDHSTIPTVIPTWLSSMGLVTAGHVAIQGRQDNTTAATPVVPPVVIRPVPTYNGGTPPPPNPASGGGSSPPPPPPGPHQ